jgi:hypothetical protein
MFSFRFTGEDAREKEREDLMAKETANHVTAAPLFAAARAVLNEVDQQTERFMEQGLQQLGEGARLVQAGQKQAGAAARAMLDTVEKMADGAAHAAASWVRT